MARMVTSVRNSLRFEQSLMLSVYNDSKDLRRKGLCYLS